MTNESNIQTVEVKKINFWERKEFRNFVTTALATFVGVFSAMSLFAALHKPVMKPCHMGPHHMKRPAMHHQFDRYDRYERGHRGDYNRKFEHRDYKRLEKRAVDKQLPVRVNVEPAKD